MSALISIVLIISYIVTGNPELIIAAGLFDIGCEVAVLADKTRGEIYETDRRR